MLISGVTPEELLHIVHDTGLLGSSPLSRSGSLVPFPMASRASSSRTVGVQVLVAFFLQRQHYGLGLGIQSFLNCGVQSVCS